MLRAFKTKLKLNNKQKTLMAQHAGYSRWIWNWALGMWNEAYKEGLKLSTNKLKKFYTNHVKPNYSWQYTLSSRVYQFAFRHLSEAFNRFFQGKAKYPRFKKKGRNDRFTIDNCGQVMTFSGRRLKLPFIGWVSTYEPLPEIKTKRVTISRVADSWYISVAYEFEPEPTVKSRENLGVDVGVKVLATCSDGTVFPNPRADKRAKKKLARLQRELSRRQIGSKNRYKTQLKLAKAHQRVTNIRKDAIHKLTSWLSKNHAVIGLEDLNVSGMLKNHKLAGAIADSAFYEIRSQLEYKSEWYASQLVFADRFFPSSKTCSSCGHIQEMPLKQRVFSCFACGAVKDRDYNASVNLEHVAEGFSVIACVSE
ncbi:MAG: IS200/IS605 family element transposase accessory protein TnpB [Moorea sp. SIO1F2]|uniref:RNA-guided endonuclease InsQ/TnpB family protein n=1 Tax=unclassified Moorena TaxID=2683338 RepID=UPI0013BD515F|nr:MULTISPECIES: RNA-guided endonuclease TnpB family protein [unclassified Moorena]NEP24388.1 IS200/IS605 family element transposase accessory protein TnpB [Moorena sp. SIO3I6]NET85377.1 IS200/IS605 family element transposase accessory protein TnpB [Moorena sp. SIO1F2]